jgi:molecular chaperone DnaK (HSP70)
MNLGTTKLLVAVQRMVDATAPEENKHRTPSILGHQLEDLFKATKVLAGPAEAVVA